jgi:hypothetical protein
MTISTCKIWREELRKTEYEKVAERSFGIKFSKASWDVNKDIQDR